MAETHTTKRTRAAEHTGTADKAETAAPEATTESGVTQRRPESAASPAPADTGADHGLPVPVPMVGVHMRRVPMPPGPHAVAGGLAHGASSVTSSVTAMARSVAPDRESALFYGGLGALAVTGLLSWPVAAAIGTGVWVAGRAHTSKQPK
ncbi:hypothetical protein [Nocardia aurantiaca]|uniref:Uncharacterized protein n=1 Tax=Nocardia aurantiaca TaxID=2675850 RepID=A0A6I3L5T4_9NOCA|nr:hypothetical protein [Nocardia aurantiaca]MTE16861.1 hypothetical protein [Nocardia aurantiaca]